MRSIRALHVASFLGNIGDNANHMGFRPWLQRLAGVPIEWTNLEIREFYWKERQWDDHFVALANSHHLLVIGGGNYFELWVENSPTGTSIAIPPEVFARLRVPILFNALGVDPGQGVPDVALTRFKTFLDTLLGSQRCLVTVRNDGAHETLRQFVGNERANAVERAPDGGFFVPLPEPTLKPAGILRVGMNLASDMPEVRFRSFGGSDGAASFAREIAEAVGTIAARLPQTEFVLVPHIFRDLEIVTEVMGRLSDRLRRTRVSVAQYGTGDAAARGALSTYASCDAVLAMRFHANVCPLGMGRQTVGLNCYPQIHRLYAELGQPDRCIDVSGPGFAGMLAAVTEKALLKPQAFQASPADAQVAVNALRRKVEPTLTSWMRLNNLRVEDSH